MRKRKDPDHAAARAAAPAPGCDAAPGDATERSRIAGRIFRWSVADVAGMALALALAEEARAADEVPIGAVVVRDGALLGVGRNRCRGQRSCIAHAEMLALEDAFARTGDMRLPGAVVYTTVEPCFMCAGALSHARVARVVWAVRDPKFGGAASLGAVLGDTRLNHVAEVAEGLFAEEAAQLMRAFFREKREAQRQCSGDEQARAVIEPGQ